LDVALEGHRDYALGRGNEEVTRTVLKRSIFQSVASMALPAFAIHTQVRVFQHVFKKMGRFTKWGPTLMGLALVPFLPTIFDHPSEHLLDHAFDRFWPTKYSHAHAHAHAHTHALPSPPAHIPAPITAHASVPAALVPHMEKDKVKVKSA
jgi:hypothetical protein